MRILLGYKIQQKLLLGRRYATDMADQLTGFVYYENTQFFVIVECNCLVILC